MTRRTGVSECVNELFVMFLSSSGENNRVGIQFNWRWKPIFLRLQDKNVDSYLAMF